MPKLGELKRLEIPYFDGVNTLVASNISKKNELSHAENARSQTIGTIEKREGTRRLGDDLGATGNYDLIYFDNNNLISANKGIYRISETSNLIKLYYLNNSSNWTLFNQSPVNGFNQFGGATSQFDITSPLTNTFRYTWDGTGTNPNIELQLGIGTQVIINGDNFTAANNGTFEVTGIGTNYFEVTNASGVAENNKTLGATGYLRYVPSQFSHTIAEGCLFFVDGNFENLEMYFNNGATVWGYNVTYSSQSTQLNHLYNSPKARKINYYKNRLYVGDFLKNGTRYKNKIMRSSEPAGIIALINGDHKEVSGGANFSLGDSTTQFDITNPSGTTFRYKWDGTGSNPQIGLNIAVNTDIIIAAQNFNVLNNGTFLVTAVDSDNNYFEVTNATGSAENNVTIGTGSIKIGKIKITDTKYIYPGDILDIYRGGVKIQSIYVLKKTEDSILVQSTSLSSYSLVNNLNSSDELWVANTYTVNSTSYSGKRLFRWASIFTQGIDVKQYDTFEVTTEQDERIKMMTNIGNVMMIGTNNNLAAWNNYNLKNFNLGVGCISDNGYVKNLSTLFFMHYNGIYATNGDLPKLISSKVERYIKGATRAGLEASSAGKKGYSIFFNIGDVTLYYPDGSIEKTLSDVVLEYNIRQDNWYPHVDIPASQFTTYMSSDDSDRLEFIDSSNYEIYEFLDGEVDDRVTSNKEIPFRIDSDNITLAKSFENISYPLKIIIETERGSDIKCFVSLDNQPFYEIEGTAIKGCTILKVTSKDKYSTQPPRCRKIKISLRDFTKKLCKISRVALIYAESMEEENIKQEPYG